MAHRFVVTIREMSWTLTNVINRELDALGVPYTTNDSNRGCYQDRLYTTGPLSIHGAFALMDMITKDHGAICRYRKA